MRQSHQKSRSRGRNRKPHNPLSRNYESNGPDVKIRGNASHIAEKYSSLARDALSNGDTVMAENYFQHAEHYNRIIAAAQAQSKSEENQQSLNGRGPQPGTSDDESNSADNANQSDDAVAADSSADDDQKNDDKAERKQSRGRRTKRAASEKSGNDEDDTASQSKEAEVNGHDVNVDAKPADPEIISEDAAKLPESITGALSVEEGQ